MAAKEFNLVSLLPDHIFIKIMNDLSVNEIERFCDSGLDSRTEMAFDNLEHALINMISYDDEHGDKYAEINRFLSKLPSTLKSIDIQGADKRKALSIEEMGKRFPFLDRLPYCYWNFVDSYLEYITNTGKEKCDLKYITLHNYFEDYVVFNLITLLQMCPKLKQLKSSDNYLNDEVVNYLATYVKPVELIVENKPHTLTMDYERRKKLIIALPASKITFIFCIVAEVEDKSKELINLALFCICIMNYYSCIVRKVH